MTGAVWSGKWPIPATPYWYERYQRPEKLSDLDPAWRDLPEALRLPTAIRVGAKPGFYPAEDADKRWQERVAKKNQQRQPGKWRRPRKADGLTA